MDPPRRRRRFPSRAPQSPEPGEDCLSFLDPCIDVSAVASVPPDCGATELFRILVAEEEAELKRLREAQGGELGRS